MQNWRPNRVALGFHQWFPKAVLRYFSRLPKGKVVLWCYLLWWSVVITNHFRADPRLWLTSVGLSIIIAAALLINATNSGETKLDRWQVFRFFLIPFCVSSFAASIRGEGFLLVFPPSLMEDAVGMVVIAAFLAAVQISRALSSWHPKSSSPQQVHQRLQANEPTTGD